MSDAIKALEGFSLYGIKADGEIVSFIRKAARTLKPIRMGEYLGFTLIGDDGQRHRRYLHRIVCEAFHGKAKSGQHCRHIDGDKTNNAAENLSWGSPSENNLDKDRHGTSPHGERNPMARLTRDQVKRMRDIRETTGRSYYMIAKGFSISTMTAYRAITGETWK